MLRSLSALAAGGALLVSSSAAAVEVSRTPAPLGDHEQIARIGRYLLAPAACIRTP